MSGMGGACGRRRRPGRMRRGLRCLASAVLALVAVPSARAADIWSRPPVTATTIAGCTPGALTIGLGCLRIGGSVEIIPERVQPNVAAV